MRFYFAFILLVSFQISMAQTSEINQKEDATTIKQIFDTALTSGKALIAH